MKCFRLAAVVTGISPLGGSAVEIPEDTEKKRRLRKRIANETVCRELTTTKSVESPEARPELYFFPNESEKKL